MQKLKNAIRTKGKALNADVLLVDSFLNHQVDVALMRDIGEAFAEHFKSGAFTRVVTIESSGIAPAAFTALALGLPLVVMKKQTSKIHREGLYKTTVFSFTKGVTYELTIKKDFISEQDNVLFIDDFLASGEAAFGVLEIVKQAGAQIGGIGIVIEKSFQAGHDRLVEAGVDVYSLARVKAMGEDMIEFIEE